MNSWESSHGFEWEFISFAILQLVLLFVVQTWWAYEDRITNNSDHPILISLLQITVTFIICIGAVIVFLYTNNLIFEYTGISIFVPLTIILFSSFIVYTLYQTSKAEITE